MPASPVWRDDVDSLTFVPDGHDGVCMVHRRAFRTLLRMPPTPLQCADFFAANRDAFQAAAHAKIARAKVAPAANLHLTSRDVRRQLQE